MAPFGKKKAGKNEVVFQVHIHSVEPWPQQAAGKPLAVAWERGSSHKGVTDASSAVSRAGSAVYEFEETLVVPCTLIQVQDHPRSVQRRRFPCCMFRATNCWSTACWRRKLTPYLLSHDACSNTM